MSWPSVVDSVFFYLMIVGVAWAIAWAKVKGRK